MNIETIKENSYKNFHAKGLHYICLERSPLVTTKAYFFEGDISSSPEVVVPHTHRYDFLTETLAGEVVDIEYQRFGNIFPISQSRMYMTQIWDYYTPLNGGNGFQWVGETNLLSAKRRIVKPGEKIFTSSDMIHTIKVKPDTVLLLTQLQDKVAIGVPTQAYSYSTKEQKPNTSGLYEKFDDDEIVNKLETLRMLGVAL